MGLRRREYPISCGVPTRAIKNSIYIRSKGKIYGPYNEDEFATTVAEGRVPFAAWVYRGESWQLLAAIPELRSKHPEYEDMPDGPPDKDEAQSARDLPQAAPAAVSLLGTGATVSADPVWFVVRDKKKFGPYSAADLVSQLQRKQLESSSFVWRPGFSTWQRMSQVGEFSRDAMKRLAGEGAPVDILVKRKHQRAPYEVEVIAHDNTKAIEGKTMVVGEGGLFLALTGAARPTHHVGSRLKLHFREGDAPPFNAVAEVVSVVRGDAPGYCLRFVALSDGDRRRIAKLVSERSKSK